LADLIFGLAISLNIGSNVQYTCPRSLPSLSKNQVGFRPSQGPNYINYRCDKMSSSTCCVNCWLRLTENIYCVLSSWLDEDGGLLSGLRLCRISTLF
jgi:hypothetical protein